AQQSPPLSSVGPAGLPLVGDRLHVLRAARARRRGPDLGSPRRPQPHRRRRVAGTGRRGIVHLVRFPPANLQLRRAQLILMLVALVPTVALSVVGIVLLASGSGSPQTIVARVLVLTF